MILEQHGFEMHRSTYTQIFFFNQYYSTTQPVAESAEAGADYAEAGADYGT